ncbi:serine protease [Blastopirellula marina]|nr:serine protease [Blastopirellula marina]
MMSGHWSVVAVLCFLATSAAAAEADEKNIERWDRVVFLKEVQQEPEKKLQHTHTSSGFLVAEGGQYCLITAGHGAEKTSPKTEIYFRSPEGKTAKVLLGDITADQGDPWHRHLQADLAVARVAIRENSPEAVQQLFALAIPMEDLLATSPRRTTAIEVTGFPMRLGLKPAISPLVMTGRVASRELPISAKWGDETIVLAQAAIAPGISGGAVFAEEPSPDKCRVVGMCIGFLMDNRTEVKLAKIVPSHILMDFMRQEFPPPAN